MQDRDLSRAGIARITEVAQGQIEHEWHGASQLAVYRDGNLQLDQSFGDASDDSLFLYFSATKPIAAVAVLTLIERNELTLDTRVAEVWPEFGAGGKEACTVRDVLTHRGGFPVFPADYDWTRIDDWYGAVEATAAIAAEWEPGTATGYHPVTYGFALGEVIRRVDGREPRKFMREEIFEPLGMACSLGATNAEERERVILPVAMSEVTFDDPAGSEARTSGIVERFRLSATLRGQLPAANAIGTAEALARFYSMLERRWNESEDYAGVCPLSPAMVRRATSVQNAVDFDRTSHLPSSYGLGFLVGGPFAPFDQPDVFGHSGQQCVASWADPHRGLAVAYVTNGLQDPLTVQLRTEQMAAAIIEACD